MPEIHWDKFLSLDYWLEGVSGSARYTPVILPDSPFFWFFLVFFAMLAIIGVWMKVGRYYINLEHPLQTKIPFWSDNLLAMGLLGLFWFVLRQFGVQFLGARFWLLVGLAWFVVVAVLAARYFKDFYNLEYLYYKKKAEERKVSP